MEEQEEEEENREEKRKVTYRKLPEYERDSEKVRA